VRDPDNLFDYNRSMYARGNPLKYADPSGHVPGGPLRTPGDNSIWAGGAPGGSGALAALAAAIASFFTLQPQNGSLLTHPDSDVPDWKESWPLDGYDGITIGGIVLEGYEPNIITSDPTLPDQGMNVLADPLGAGIDTSPYLSSGNQASPRNAPEIINGRLYTGHALDRMEQYGLVPEVIENTIRIGDWAEVEDKGVTTFYDAINDVRVIVANDTGNIITAGFGIPSNMK
jgi:hypothetical protein